MNQKISREFCQSLSGTVREVTRRFGGVELTEAERPLHDRVCTVHTVLEGRRRTHLLLCADTDLLVRLARNILGRETVTEREVEEVATEYGNVVCGRIAGLLFRAAHVPSRFQVPRFHPGRYLPEGAPAVRLKLGYHSPQNESLHLICMQAVEGGAGTPPVCPSKDAEQE